MKRAVIISGGKIQTDFALAFLRTQTWDYVIGADKGVIFCHKNQIMPTHIVGDFDSAGETEYEYFQKNTDVPIKRLNPVKDYTDTDVALRLAMELGAEEITILGGTGRTHRIVPCPDCRLQPGVLNEIGNVLCAFFAEKGIQPYSEETGRGLVRHIFLRRGAHSGQIMVCLVCTRAKLPSAEELCTRLKAQFAEITTILLNVNAKNTNVILGTETHTLYGQGYIEDTLCGVPVQLGPLSFYQVNTLAAEQLYGIAAQYAQLTPDDLLLDLYCGMGTIGLSMAAHCRELIGVEIVPEAIESAKANAARMGADVAAKSRFFCADAGQAATRLAAEGLQPDIVMLDPPRKGCDEDTLSAVVRMSPRRVVYVSCNPATAARDAAWLEQNGYHAEKVQPVDLFPRTRHCEAVLLLTKLHVERHIEVDVSMDELDVTAAESKATYNEIRDYVWEHHQLKVSNLYIAQVKQKYGIIERENYHKAKNENAKQPQCPKEKEDAIVEALKHFQMI